LTTPAWKYHATPPQRGITLRVFILFLMIIAKQYRNFSLFTFRFSLFGVLCDEGFTLPIKILAKEGHFIIFEIESMLNLKHLP
jgi:hypothetical protein